MMFQISYMQRKGKNKMKCCFCKKDAGKYGNNALPIMDGRCCDKCNANVVIPIRILRMRGNIINPKGEKVK